MSMLRKSKVSESWLPAAQALFVGAAALCAWFVADVRAVTIETVPVGNPGNAPDIKYTSSGPFGQVNYSYRMGKFEVTNEQYATFLNAVAGGDFNGLFHTLMQTDDRGGIIRTGASGSYSYQVKDNMGDKPVIAVNLWDAVRFVNWLHNGQPTGGQSSATTEDGAYALGGLAPVDNPTWTRKAGATWFLPTENEWYKAAFFDPRQSSAGGPPGGDHYWLYPTRSDVPPTVAMADAQGNISNPGANVANYNGGGGWNGLTMNLTTVGSAGPQSTSFYGTSDQGGNIHELLETPLPPQHYVSRGGTYGSVASLITAAARTGNYASVDQPSSGFRVASIADGSGSMPGDYNQDGDVDLADYDQWKTSVGTIVTPGDAADGSLNGVVDAADYTVWRDHVSSGSAAVQTIAVPEAGAGRCLALALVVACLIDWRGTVLGRGE